MRCAYAPHSSYLFAAAGSICKYRRTDSGSVRHATYKGNTNAASSEQLPAGGGHRLRAARLACVRDRQRQAHPGHRRPAGRVGDGPCAEVRLLDPHHPAGHLRRAAQVRGRPRRAQALAGHVLDRQRRRHRLDLQAGPAREIPERRSGGRRRGQGLVRAHAQAEQGPGLDVHRFPQAREHQRRRPADAALHAQPSLRGLPQPAALVVRGQRQAGHGQRAQWRLWPAMADRSHRRLRPLPRQARRTQFLYELEAWDGYWKGWPQPEKRAWAASSTASSPRTPAAAHGARRDRHRRQPVARGPGPARIGQGREDRPQGRHRHGRIRSEIQYAGQVHVRPEPAPRPGLRLRLRLLAEDLQRPRA